MWKGAIKRCLRIRFSLRALLTLVTLCCLWLGWDASLVHARRAMLLEVESRGGRIIGGTALVNGFASNSTPSQWPASGNVTALTVLPDERPISWTRQLMGDHTIGVIYLPSGEFSDDDGRRIQAAFPEALLLPGPFGMQSLAESRAGDS
jgi:hypothetical protein